jgi:hypothetical protein
LLPGYEEARLGVPTQIDGELASYNFVAIYRHEAHKAKNNMINPTNRSKGSSATAITNFISVVCRLCTDETSEETTKSEV